MFLQVIVTGQVVNTTGLYVKTTARPARALKCGCKLSILNEYNMPVGSAEHMRKK